MSDPLRTLDLQTVNAMDRDTFVAALGTAFEHSPWVAEQAWERRPFADVDALHAAMFDVVASAPQQDQVAFLCAHPDLAGAQARAGTMTRESVGEQASAGLDALNAAEADELRALNARYRERHGFPFIVAVRHHTKQQILEQFRRRIERDGEAERAEALRQIAAITRLRVYSKVTP